MNHSSDEVLARIGALCDEKKGLDLRVLDASGVVGYADWIVLVSCTSDRHVVALADALRRGLRELGEKAVEIEGTEFGRWVVLDYGEIVIHVLLDDVREYYSFDSLWADAKVWAPAAPRATQRRRSRA
jgi:ribosome-associated protein